MDMSNLKSIIKEKYTNSEGNLNTKAINADYRKGLNKIFYNIVMSYPGEKLRDKLLYICNGGWQKCQTCGKDIHCWSNHANGLKRFCSPKCGNNNPKKLEATSKIGKSKSTIEKRKNTCLERYGCESPFHSTEIQEKIKETIFEKYGVYNVGNTDVAKHSRNKFNSNRNINLEIKNRNKKVLEKYELSYEDYHLSMITHLMPYELLKRIVNNDIPTTIYDSCFDGVSISHRYKYARKLGIKVRKMITMSQGYLTEFLKNNNIDVKLNDRKLIYPNELDIVIPEYKIAIECNGSYWHSNKKYDSEYHKMKTYKCRDAGYSLIHVWDWDNLEDIKQLLLGMINDNLSDNIIEKYMSLKNNIYYLDLSKDISKFLLQKGYTSTGNFSPPALIHDKLENCCIWDCGQEVFVLE